MDGRPRKAVVLCNMGGPETLDDVRPFLFNLFRDPQIIPVPWWLRWLRLPLAWLIAKMRAPASRHGYEKIGGGSPQRRHAQSLADKLQQQLSAQHPDSEWQVRVCMRYFAPFADEVVTELKSWDAQEVLLFPLYPQYSTTTTRSSFSDFHRACRDATWQPSVRVVRNWHLRDTWLTPAATRLQTTLQEAKQHVNSDGLTGEPLLLYSAHGVPMDRIRAGDPYADQVRECITALHERVGLPGQPELAYQSRVGPVAWLAPSIADRIPRLAAQHAGRPLVIFPVSFVSDHIETLEELDITYRDLALASGFSSVHRVPVFNDDDDFACLLAQDIAGRFGDRQRCWPTDCVVYHAKECHCVQN